MVKCVKFVSDACSWGADWSSERKIEAFCPRNSDVLNSTTYWCVLFSSTTLHLGGISAAPSNAAVGNPKSSLLCVMRCPRSMSSCCSRLLVSVAIHDDWFGLGISRVVPTEVYSRPPTSSRPKRDGVLEFFQEGGVVAANFEHFCTRNLCGEGWDFVVAACKYEV